MRERPPQAPIPPITAQTPLEARPLVSKTRLWHGGRDRCEYEEGWRAGDISARDKVDNGRCAPEAAGVGMEAVGQERPNVSARALHRTKFIH